MYDQRLRVSVMPAPPQHMQVLLMPAPNPDVPELKLLIVSCCLYPLIPSLEMLVFVAQHLLCNMHACAFAVGMCPYWSSAFSGLCWVLSRVIGRESL